MSDNLHHDRGTRLFLLLAAFFIANAIIAEFIGVKIFSLERSLGLEPVHWSLFTDDVLALNLTAGVVLWPVVFVMTDLINEYYGVRGVRLLSFLAVAMISYAFVMVFATMQLVPADFWRVQGEGEAALDMNRAFNAIFGQGLWIVGGSLVAFLVGQLVDVHVFHAVKRLTGERFIWLRSTGSTILSQLIDSFVVLFIAFYVGADWSLALVLSVGIVNYAYKFSMALLLTPVLYAVHGLIERYLGPELAARLRKQAMDS